MSRWRSFGYPAVLVGLVWLMAGTWAGTASARDPNKVLSLDSKLNLVLMMSSKVVLTLDTKQGLLENLLELNRKVGADIVTLLPDRQPQTSAALAFEQEPFDQVLDKVAEAYGVRWRLVTSPLCQGATILFEEKGREDDRTQLEKLKEEMAREVTQNGWLLPKPTDGAQRPLSAAYGRKETQALREVDQRLDAVTRQRLATEGIPFSQLPVEIQQSVGSLVEAGNRKWAHVWAEEILEQFQRLKK